jgi:formate dehydrogenase
MANPAGVQRAGHGEGLEAGENLFRAIIAGRSGIVTTDDTDDETWRRIGDRKLQLDIPELLSEVERLADRAAPVVDEQWPYVLSAGERRAFTANTIIRDPAWRKRDTNGALRVSEHDAAKLGLEAGSMVRLSTRRGSVDVAVEPNPRMRPGHISLPNGMGLTSGETDPVGIAPNELTSSEDQDELSGIPLHKHVLARIDVL